MKDVLVTAKAFTLPPPVEIPELEMQEFLQKLYGNGASCYDRSDDNYDRQLTALFNSWRSVVGHSSYDFNAGIGNVSNKFSKYSTAYQGTEQQLQATYSEAKRLLEKIAFYIKDYSQADKRNYLVKFGKRIKDSCGPGVFTILSDTVFAISSADTVPYWLAADRQLQLETLSEIRFAKVGMGDAWSMHTATVCHKLAALRGWGVPVSDKLRNFNDQYASRPLSEEERYWFCVEFERTINRQHVIKVVTDKYEDIFKHFGKMDLTDADNLTAFNKILAQFPDADGNPLLANKVIDFDDDGKTIINESFWADLPELCEQMLEREGFLVPLKQEKENTLAQVQFAMEMPTAENRQIILETLIPNMNALVQCLMLLPEDTAILLLDEMKDFFRSKIKGPAQLLDVMYQLRPSVAKILSEKVGYSSSGSDQLTRTIIQKIREIEAIDDPNLDAMPRGQLSEINMDPGLKHPKKNYKQQESDKLERLERFIRMELMLPLQLERSRLIAKYDKNDSRVGALDDCIARLSEKTREPDLATQTRFQLHGDLSSILHEHLIKDRRVSKHPSWGKRLMLGLLNVLSAALLFVPALIKYAATGSCFFSLNGKTHDMASKIYDKVWKVPVIK